MTQIGQYPTLSRMKSVIIIICTLLVAGCASNRVDPHTFVKTYKRVRGPGVREASITLLPGERVEVGPTVVPLSQTFETLKDSGLTGEDVIIVTIANKVKKPEMKKLQRELFHGGYRNTKYKRPVQTEVIKH